MATVTKPEVDKDERIELLETLLSYQRDQIEAYQRCLSGEAGFHDASESVDAVTEWVEEELTGCDSDGNPNYWFDDGLVCYPAIIRLDGELEYIPKVLDIKVNFGGYESSVSLHLNSYEDGYYFYDVTVGEQIKNEELV